MGIKIVRKSKLENDLMRVENELLKLKMEGIRVKKHLIKKKKFIPTQIKRSKIEFRTENKKDIKWKRRLSNELEKIQKKLNLTNKGKLPVINHLIKKKLVMGKKVKGKELREQNISIKAEKEKIHKESHIAKRLKHEREDIERKLHNLQNGIQQPKKINKKVTKNL